MKLWIDDVRPAPEGYVWCKSVSQTKSAIRAEENHKISFPDSDYSIELIDIDHDAGDYAIYGGDYIEILNWMEANEVNNIPVHIHSMNPVGAENMRRIIKRNGWKEV